MFLDEIQLLCWYLAELLCYWKPALVRVVVVVLTAESTEVPMAPFLFLHPLRAYQSCSGHFLGVCVLLWTHTRRILGVALVTQAPSVAEEQPSELNIRW